jgi:hypothetical protein
MHETLHIHLLPRRRSRDHRWRRRRAKRTTSRSGRRVCTDHGSRRGQRVYRRSLRPLLLAGILRQRVVCRIFQTRAVSSPRLKWRDPRQVDPFLHKPVQRVPPPRLVPPRLMLVEPEKKSRSDRQTSKGLAGAMLLCRQGRGRMKVWGE